MRPNDAPDHYELLGVPKTATQAEVKAAWVASAKRLHPDMGGNPAMFRMAKEAYDILSDPRRRAEYDRGNRQGTNAADPGQSTSAQYNYRPSEQSDSNGSDHSEHKRASHLGLIVKQYTPKVLAILMIPDAYAGYALHEWFPGHSQGWEMLIAIGYALGISGVVWMVAYAINHLRPWHRILAVAFVLLVVIPRWYVWLPVSIEAAWIAFRLLAPPTWSPVWAIMNLVRRLAHARSRPRTSV